MRWCNTEGPRSRACDSVNDEERQNEAKPVVLTEWPFLIVNDVMKSESRVGSITLSGSSRVENSRFMIHDRSDPQSIDRG